MSEENRSNRPDPGLTIDTLLAAFTRIPNLGVVDAINDFTRARMREDSLRSIDLLPDTRWPAIDQSEFVIETSNEIWNYENPWFINPTPIVRSRRRVIEAEIIRSDKR